MFQHSDRNGTLIASGEVSGFSALVCVAINKNRRQQTGNAIRKCVLTRALIELDLFLQKRVIICGFLLTLFANLFFAGVRSVIYISRIGTSKRRVCCSARMTIGPSMVKVVSSVPRFVV